MNDYFTFLPPDEQIPLKLRSIYEQFGYKKFSMSNFEPYDLYRDHKNFIKSESIITFTAANGSLMALRPDVTTSIVKHLRENTTTEKLYYIENVFRLDEKSRDYKEIPQIGIECIGGEMNYSQSEIILLAFKSLSVLSEDYRLNVNHMGLIEGALEYAGFNPEDVEAVKGAIKHKNVHDISYLSQKSNISQDKVNKLCAFTEISGDFNSAIKTLEECIFNEKMKAAYDELCELFANISDFIPCEKLNIDVSVINDIGYYNALVFRGYIKEAAAEVLSGGRYDNMMKRFSKKQQALGFALYLGELRRALHRSSKYDADILLVANNMPVKELLENVETLQKQGFSVICTNEKDDSLRTKKVLIAEENGLKEVGADA